MPLPADPAKTPDSLVVLAWNWFTLRMGIDLLVTLRPLNRRGWDDYSPRSGNPMPAKRFVRRSVRASHNAASARSSRLAVRTRGRTSARTHRVRNKFWQSPVRYQPATNRCGVHKRLPPGFRIIASVGWKRWRTARTSRDCHTQFLAVGVPCGIPLPAEVFSVPAMLQRHDVARARIAVIAR
jgi:hypothetical protein